MANVNTTYQQIKTFSVNRQAFLEAVVYNDSLTENDLRIICLLLTQLDGFRYEKIYHNKDGKEVRQWNNDPKNFKSIDIKRISKSLKISKKEVKQSLHRLLEECILDQGSNESVKDGYRFTF